MGKYIHTLKFTHSGTIYIATIEDDNDDVKYKSIVNRVKTKIFNGLDIEVVEVIPPKSKTGNPKYIYKVLQDNEDKMEFPDKEDDKASEYESEIVEQGCVIYG